MAHPITASAAGSWRLGDLAVNRLGFGAMRLTGRAPFGRDTTSDRAQSIAVLRRAADQLRGQVEENLRQLGRDHLDVVNLRRMSQESITEHFAALAELRDVGLIRHLGVSNVSVGHLAEALAIAPVVCVQNRYSLDFRDQGDAVLRECAERAIAFVPFFAIASDRRDAGGARSTGAESGAVLTVARRHGATPAQVRLAWTLHQGPNVLAIPGTGDPRHLDENVAAAGLRLTVEDLALLAE